MPKVLESHATQFRLCSCIYPCTSRSPCTLTLLKPAKPKTLFTHRGSRNKRSYIVQLYPYLFRHIISTCYEMKCAPDDLVLSIISIVLYSLCCSLCLWLTYLYMTKQNDILQSDPCHYCMALFLFILIILTFIIWATSWVFRCIDTHMEALIGTLGNAVYGVQYYLLLWMLFYRLCQVFEGSIFEVSSCMKKIFYISYFICSPLMVLCVCITSYDVLQYMKWTPLVLLFGFLLLLFTVGILFGIFVQRLIIVSKNTQRTAQDYMPVATKALILSVTSVISLLFLGIILVLESFVGYTTYIACLKPLSAATDIFSNYLSIWLHFKTFEKYYMKICGLCHIKCMDCCRAMVSENEIRLSNVISHSNDTQKQIHNVDKPALTSTVCV
eukprot:108954_1